jgi:DNA repair photolyase
VQASGIQFQRYPLAARAEIDRQLVIRGAPTTPVDVWFLNLYRRCDVRCVYCSTAGPGRSDPVVPGESLADELATALADVPRDHLVLLGAARDAYPNADREHRLARIALEVLRNTGHRVSVLTKGTGVLRDVDLLLGDPPASVSVSLSTVDAETARTLEPGAASPAERIDTLHRLHDAGIPTSLHAAPWIPGVTDLRAMRNLLRPEIKVVVSPLVVEGGLTRHAPFSRKFDQRTVDRMYLQERISLRSLPRTQWNRPPALVGNDPEGVCNRSMSTTWASEHLQAVETAPYRYELVENIPMLSVDNEMPIGSSL